MFKKLLLCAIALVGIAATAKVKVSGVVLQEEDEEPVIGATVTVKGTNIATATDLDGKFTVTAHRVNQSWWLLMWV